jgi:hypothetical protein
MGQFSVLADIVKKGSLNMSCALIPWKRRSVSVKVPFLIAFLDCEFQGIT